MKVWISRATYQRLADGMSPAEQQALDQCVEVYPDDIPPEPLVVDQGRVADRYADLLAGDPLGQFQARVTERQERFGAAWMQVAELLSEIQQEEVTARRYFLNDVVVDTGQRGIYTTAPTTAEETTADPITLDQIREFIRRWLETPWASPRIIQAGIGACDRFAAIAEQDRATRTSWAKDTYGAAGSLAALTGIPIVLDATLPPDVWRLVDRETGEVLYEHNPPAGESQDG
jgi:hypothetical protein